MEKILKIMLIIVVCCIVFVGGNVYASEDDTTEPTITETQTTPEKQEETTDKQEEIEEIVYPCKVVSILSKGGDVMFDIEEGQVGDVVTAYVKADFLFVTSSVQINGTSIELSSDGKYQFTLVEGDNIFSVDFKVNNEKLTEIANLINGVQTDGFSSLFTVNNLLNLISWGISVLLSSGFFITLIKNNKLKSKTVDEVLDVVVNALQTEEAKTLNEFLDKLIGPTLETMTTKMDGMNECMMVFCRCFILAQEDTPENRLAIINELTKLNNSDEKLSAQIREIVKEEQKAQEEKIAARDKALEELKQNNANLIEDNSEEKESDSYGQI